MNNTSGASDLMSRVTDIATCPICLDLFDKPKSLPCLHTFCLKCLEDHCRSQKLESRSYSCPACRQEFSIPETGIHGLLNNFFVESLVDARRCSVNEGATTVHCEVCLAENDPEACGEAVPACTVFCVDCNQKLCDQCSRPHRRMKGGAHELIPIGSEAEIRRFQTHGAKCDKHKDDDVRLYCFDCMVNICVICFAEQHQQHRCQNVATVAEMFTKEIEADLEHVKKLADVARKAIGWLDEERDKFLENTEEIGKHVVDISKELRKLVDNQVNERMMKVGSLKTKTCKEIESHRDNVETKLLVLETFIAYSNELQTKGKPCDITGAAGALHSRASELTKTDIAVATDYRAPVVTFRHAGQSEETMSELFGYIESKALSVGCQRTSSQHTADASLSDELQTIKAAESGCNPHQQQKRDVHCEPETRSEKLSKAASEQVRNLQVQVEQLKKIECDLKLRLGETERKLWNSERQVVQMRDRYVAELTVSAQVDKQTADEIQQLKAIESDLKIKLGEIEMSFRKMHEENVKLRMSEGVLKTKQEHSEEHIQQLTRSETDLQDKLQWLEMSIINLTAEAEQLRENERLLKAELAEAAIVAPTVKLQNSRPTKNEEAEQKVVDKLVEVDKKKPQISPKPTGHLRRSETQSTWASKPTAMKNDPWTPILPTKKEQPTKVVPSRSVSAASVVHTFTEAERIWGIASIHDQLYILRNRATYAVDVYHITTYKLLRHLPVPGSRSLRDMVACAYYECLYISDPDGKCIHRLESHGKPSSWPASDKSNGMSVTPYHNVLLTCLAGRKLQEFTTRGKLVREISLQSDVCNPLHAIQLSNDQFIVCHGAAVDMFHRICKLDADGHTVKSYGGRKGSAAAEQLDGPARLAVDADGSVFVADVNNRRVLRLSPDLSSMREIVSGDRLKWKPRRLFLDAERRRLYVGESEWIKDGEHSPGRVVVIEL